MSGVSVAYSKHEWEHPVAAVLDYYGLAGVCLIGVSLGGGLAVRAAAFEPRVVMEAVSADQLAAQPMGSPGRRSAALSDIRGIAPHLTDYSTSRQLFLQLAETALADGDLLRAAFHVRAAEFFVRGDDPDKQLLRAHFVESVLRSRSMKHQDRDLIPYRNGWLPAYRFPASTRRDGRADRLAWSERPFASFRSCVYMMKTATTEPGVGVIKVRSSRQQPRPVSCASC